MVLNVHRNRTGYWADGEKWGKGVWRWGEREIIYLSLHCQCHHQNDFCIKMGSDESHFNVSVGSDGQTEPQDGVHGTLETITFLVKRKESRSGISWTAVLPLTRGRQTSSLVTEFPSNNLTRTHSMHIIVSGKSPSQSRRMGKLFHHYRLEGAAA